MPKLEVIKVEWVNENEAHMYPPDGGTDDVPVVVTREREE